MVKIQRLYLHVYQNYYKFCCIHRDVLFFEYYSCTIAVSSLLPGIMERTSYVVPFFPDWYDDDDDDDDNEGDDDSDDDDGDDDSDDDDYDDDDSDDDDDGVFILPCDHGTRSVS